MKMRRILIFGICLVQYCLLFCACDVSGENRVSTDGSTSMEKTIGTLGEAYMLQHPEVCFTFNPTGSGSGIAAVADGRCDIGLSSRHLSETEKSRGLGETVLAYDGIAVVVHPENPLISLTMDELSAIYIGDVTDWRELGGRQGVIVPVGREAASGTRSGFEDALGVREQCCYRQELTSAGDVMTSVSQNPNAIGYTSLASVNNSVKVLAVDGVFPSEESIRSNTYKVQRPFVLVTRSGDNLSVAAQDFYDYITSVDAVELICCSGVIPAITKEGGEEQ